MGNAKSKKLQKKQPERLYYIDVLNILACFFVVLLHCTGVIFNYENSARWCIAAALNSITRSAVPVFVTITGITLLEYRSKYNTETFFKKRFLRTLVPFVIWSVIYVIWNEINAGNGFPSAGDFMMGIMNCKATNVFWFFYLLFGLYLSIPVLSLIAEKKNEKIIYYYATLCILVNGLIPFYNYFSPYKLSGNFTIPIASGYIIYLLFGYILKNESYKREIRLAVYIVGVLTVLVTFFGTVYISKKAGKSEGLFFDCSVIPMSFAYTLFAKHMWKLIEKKNASDATPPPFAKFAHTLEAYFAHRFGCKPRRLSYSYYC